MVTQDFVLSHIADTHGWRGRSILGTWRVGDGEPMMLVARLDVDTSTGCLKPPFHESILLSELAEDDFS